MVTVKSTFQPQRLIAVNAVPFSMGSKSTSNEIAANMLGKSYLPNYLSFIRYLCIIIYLFAL